MTDKDDPNNSTNYVINSVPAALTPIIPENTSIANYSGAMVYFADYEGKLWKVSNRSRDSLRLSIPF